LRAALALALALLLAVAAAVIVAFQYSRARGIRQALFDELTPVTLANCELARYGNAHDGGYLVCHNLMSRAKAAYSYGIDGRDEWGCQVARELSIPLHQYDCFNTQAPLCPGVDTFFHPVCVGPRTETVDGRRFGTFTEQIAKNGDTGKPLLMKVDVEGSEWTSFLATPDDRFRDIEQLVVEFHGVERPRFVDVVRRLKQFFYVANVHVNNYGCAAGFAPFTSEVFEVLLVNRQIALLSPTPRAERHHPLDAPNASEMPDCQGMAATRPEVTQFGRWLYRLVRRLVVGPRFAEV
jgi:hypothetical protein